MTKSRVALLGSAMMVLVSGVGLANAQDYSRPSYYDYGDRPALADESVVVRPYYDRVEKRQLVGRVNGEVNPTEYSLSRLVDFSDLDLSRYLDRLELRDRVRHAAEDLCAELDDRVPGLRGDPSADRECVRTATRNAMRSVRYDAG
jgi:UrcA family protein